MKVQCFYNGQECLGNYPCLPSLVHSTGGDEEVAGKPSQQLRMCYLNKFPCHSLFKEKCSSDMSWSKLLSPWFGVRIRDPQLGMICFFEIRLYDPRGWEESIFPTVMTKWQKPLCKMRRRTQILRDNVWDLCQFLILWSSFLCKITQFLSYLKPVSSAC